MATSDIPFYVPVKFSSRSLGVLAGRVYMGVAAKKRHKEREIGEGGEGRKICVKHSHNYFIGITFQMIICY